MKRNTFLVSALAVALGSLASTQIVQAQTWPAKPIRLIVSYPPGGPVDGIARLMMPLVSKELGQAIIIENRAGAAGAMGIASAVRAEPDGYTFGVGVLGVLAITPHLGKVPFRPEEVKYVTMLTKSPHALVTNPAKGIRDLKSFVDAARAVPGKLNYGSPGQGSSTHLDGELLQQEAKIDILHVPYKGGAAAINALLGGEVQMLAVEVSAAIPLKDKISIAAIMGDKRLPQLPNVPTTVELGYRGVIASSMYGIVAPSGTPDEITNRFRAAVHKVLVMPQVRDRLLSQGQTPMPTTGEEYRQLMAEESARWGEIIRKRSLKID
ncbi:Bug family tripartite tricarboxylate transporter substrate binding protein [Alicycliphilus denitrificans]|uniref:Tripartite tricarboxylate transporter substrate binding protein n=1 Tax=Alicycliphilus denitrificans TaxID=179636 RepID=A0A3R7EC38_9BURK|nr:tripartite tricarboxylate transporter substrate binding protein [Alicycliphilus denitrificans]RKJ94586.1 tripartite tricarboxylate transporter substrate binding protein [Alicycliphilus denitrificans]